ncbi:MAG: serine/threonine-protein kinase [Planctomycetota bacterium]
MNEEKPSRIFELFEKACGLEEEARARLLAEVEASDPDLAAELEALLAADSDEGKLPVDPRSSPVPTSIVASALGGLEATDESVESALSELSGTTSHDRYEVGEEIGRGAMGRVSQTWDRVLRRQLATKTLRTDRLPSAKAPAVIRFLLEARVTGRLEHPGIVPVHDLGVDEQGRAFFTMRHVDGLNLHAVFTLAREGSEEWTRTRLLGVIQKVCEAMSFAHASGVLHRDLKPANIMVGRFGEVYVMDWGLAKIQGQESDDVRLDPEALELSSSRDDRDSPLHSRAGTVLGTPAYMPPEQATGDRDDLGPHSDVYAVGAMLYQLLSGRMPYVPNDEPVSTHVVLERLLAGPPRPVSELTSDAPPELVAICERAMAREPDDRYPDMIAMAADLRAFLENRVVSTYESGAWAEARKWIRRNRSLAVTLAGGLAATSLLGFALAWQQHQSTAAVEAERDKATVVATFLDETLSGAKPSVALERDTTMLREMLDAAVRRMDDGRLRSAPLAEYQLRHSVGTTYCDLGELEPAKAQLSRAVDLARTSGAEPQLLARTLDGLGVVMTKLSEFDLADQCIREALSIRRRINPRVHKEVASSLNSLGGLLLARGDLETPSKLLEDAVAIYRELTPDGDLDMVEPLTNLAYLHAQRAEFPAVEAHLAEALALLARDDPDSPNRYVLQNGLASLLQDRSLFDKAEAGYQEALVGLRRLMPVNHPSIVEVLTNLGSLCESRGRYAESERWILESLEMCEALYGEDHQSVATNYHNLALAKKRAGDFEASERYLKKAIEIRRRLFPEGSRTLAQSIHNLGVLLDDQEDSEGAEERYLEALEIRRRVFSQDHPEIALSLRCIGALRRQQGLWDEAVRLQTEALEMDRRIFGDSTNEAVIDDLEKLVGTLMQSGRDPALAQEYAREALAQRDAIFGENDPRTLWVLQVLAHLVGGAQRFEEASLLFRRALTLAESASAEASNLANLRSNLGLCLLRVQRFSEAESELLAAQTFYDQGDEELRAARRDNLWVLVELFKAWHQAEPGQGHDRSQAKWQAELDAN